MHDTDNGEFVTSSEVIAYSADGKEKQVLSDASTMAMYPTVSANGEKISFTTPSGEAYIINVKPNRHEEQTIDGIRNRGTHLRNSIRRQDSRPSPYLHQPGPRQLDW